MNLSKIEKIKQIVSVLLTRQSWDDTNVVLVVSTGRTGTQFLAEALNNISHDENKLVSVHEPLPDLLDFGKRVVNNRTISSYQKLYLKASRVHLLKKVKSSSNQIYLESNNNLVPLLKFLKEIFPNFRLIYVVRAPKTYVTSAYNNLQKATDNNESYTIFSSKDKRNRITAEDFPDDPYYKEWQNFSQFEKTCWHWAKYNEMIMDFIKSSEIDVKTLKFEELFRADLLIDTIKDLTHWIGIEEESLDLQSKTRIRKKVNASHDLFLSKYKDWTSEQKRFFHDMTDPIASHFGYELDES